MHINNGVVYRRLSSTNKNAHIQNVARPHFSNHVGKGDPLSQAQGKTSLSREVAKSGFASTGVWLLRDFHTLNAFLLEGDQKSDHTSVAKFGIFRARSAQIQTNGQEASTRPHESHAVEPILLRLSGRVKGVAKRLNPSVAHAKLPRKDGSKRLTLTTRQWKSSASPARRGRARGVA
jgi:hypothetical protein